MTAPPPWRPPDIGPLPADALWNAVNSHLGEPLALSGSAVAVVSPGVEPLPGALAWALRLGAGPGFVAVPATFPFAAVCGVDLTMADLPLLPAVLRDALVEGVEASLMSTLPGHRDGPPSVAARGPWGDLASAGMDRARLRWFRAEVSGAAPAPAAVDIGLDPRDLGALLAPAVHPHRVWDGLTARLTRPVDETLGRLTLPIGEARSLRPGTLVVLDGAFDPDRRRLRAGRALFAFSRQGEGWICAAVTGAEPDQSGARHAMMPDDPNRDEPFDTGLLEVRIDFDLGQRDLPLAEIEAWRPGSIVALAGEAPREGVEVTLRVNGRAVGTGDLVRIDDRIAVRLTTLRLGH